MSRLSRDHQLAGQAALLRFAKINPIGSNLLIGPIIAVLAIRFGANDFETGLIYTAVYLGGLALLAAPIICGNTDTARVFATAWMWRGIVACAYLLLPFIADPKVAVWVILGTLLLVHAIRAIGFNAQQIVMNAISLPEELPRVAASQNVWLQGASIASSLLIVTALSQAHRLSDPLWAYYGLLGLGVLFNFCAYSCLRSLPPCGSYGSRSPFKVFGLLPAVLRDSGQREVLLLTLLTIPGAIAAGYQITHLQITLHVSEGLVMAIPIGGMVMGLAGAKYAGTMSAKLGSRQLQIGSHLILGLSGLSLIGNGMLAPVLRIPVAAGGFFLSAFGLSISSTSLWALSISRLGKDRRGEVSAIFQVMYVLAGVFGLLLIAGGKLAGGLFSAGGGGAYQSVFAVWVACSAAVCLVSLSAPQYQKSTLNREVIEEERAINL